MAQHVASLSLGAALLGVASGVLFMAIFGTLWATTGIAGLRGWGTPWLGVAAVVVGALLFSGGLWLLHAAHRLSNEGADATWLMGQRALRAARYTTEE